MPIAYARKVSTVNDPLDTLRQVRLGLPLSTPVCLPCRAGTPTRSAFERKDTGCSTLADRCPFVSMSWWVYGPVRPTHFLPPYGWNITGNNRRSTFPHSSRSGNHKWRRGRRSSTKRCSIIGANVRSTSRQVGPLSVSPACNKLGVLKGGQRPPSRDSYTMSRPCSVHPSTGHHSRRQIPSSTTGSLGDLREMTPWSNRARYRSNNWDA